MSLVSFGLGPGFGGTGGGPPGPPVVVGEALEFSFSEDTTIIDVESNKVSIDIVLDLETDLVEDIVVTDITEENV